MMCELRRCSWISGALVLVLATAGFAQTSWQLASPDDRVDIRLTLAAPGRTADYPTAAKRLYYEIRYWGQTILPLSPLGIARADQAFVDDLRYVSASEMTLIDETYTMPHGKQKVCTNRCTEKTVTFENPSGAKVEIVLRAYDDGVAFRYRFGEQSDQVFTVIDEATGFQLPEGGRFWAHPYDGPGQYTPAYEGYYIAGDSVRSRSDMIQWGFPLLFCNSDKSVWGLVTEAAVDGTYCGMHLRQQRSGRVFRTTLPNPAEGNNTGSSEPSWTLPWSTPWRVVIVGSTPGAMVESTLVTNLNPPSIVADTSWIKPGRASWSWVSDHDSPQDCTKLKAFVDLCAEMGWEYSLVDANWNIMRNGTIHDLIAYADSKGVGLLLWYNSGGPHNYVTEQPRGAMNLPQVRRFEFQRLKRWGIKGVKIDFFHSDKQNVMRLYHDILTDAADAQMLVNFHGCTLPRGWSRTYPHLMTMEGVRGAECYSFERGYPARAPEHNTLLPFLRNAVGPMDYTPVMFIDNTYAHITSYGHELALPVVFESGLLHFADKPAGFLELYTSAKKFLQDVPVAWDQTRFLAGEPGDCAVIARRSGDRWYIGGINGRDAEREVSLDMSFLGDGRHNMTQIGDGRGPRNLTTRERAVTSADAISVTMRPHGGFVATIGANP